MGSTTLLTIGGIVATVIVGGLGIYLVVRKKYVGQITFFREDVLPLFDAIVKHLPDLSVLYKGQPVSEGLVLLKGALLNTGSRDIAETMVEEKVCFNLPEQFKWHTAKVISTSPKVKAEVSVSENKMTFDTGLFRCNEYVRFEALAEVPGFAGDTKEEVGDIEEELETALRITHRIADTGEVRVRELFSTYRLRRSKKWTLTTVAAGLVLIIAVGAFYWVRGWPGQIVFLMPTADNKTAEVRIVPRLDGTVKLKSTEKEFQKTLPIEEFFRKEGLTAKVVADPLIKFTLLFVVILYILFPLLMLLAFHLRERKMRKLYVFLSGSGPSS